MKRFLPYILCLLPLITFPQQEGDIWFFGNRVMMDFTQGSPLVSDSTGCPLTNPPLEIAQFGNDAILRFWEGNGQKG